MEFRKLSCGATPRQGFRVREVAVYRGPHLYSQTKMVRLQVDRERDEQPTFSFAIEAVR
jgi:hypothetical protein